MPITPLPDEILKLAEQDQVKLFFGKRFLLSFIFSNPEGNEVCRYNGSAILEGVTNSGWFRFKRDDGRILEIPWVITYIMKAEGTFTNKATGEVIKDAEYVFSFKQESNDPKASMMEYE